MCRRSEQHILAVQGRPEKAGSWHTRPHMRENLQSTSATCEGASCQSCWREREREMAAEQELLKMRLL